MNKKNWFLIALVFSLALFLAACGGDSKKEEKPKDSDKESSDNVDEDGVLTYAVDNAPEGLFMPGFYSSATDAQIIDFMHDDLITVDENLEYQPYLVDWDTEDNKVYNFTLKEGVKWHNGEELTMEDWKFAVEVVAHPDYTEDRYNYVAEIEGADEYNAGEADEVSGFVIEDDYNATITFKDAKVNNIENLLSNAMPKKELEDVDVADMASAMEIREEPVGFGPFKIKEIKQGEYVSLERFDDYWQGKPKLAEVLVKVIDDSQTLGALQSGEIDIMEIRPDDIPELETQDHIDVIEHEGLGYSYVGFRLGHRIDGENVADYDKYASKELRQAMFYALDRESIVEAYLGGKATVVNSPVPSVHWIRADESELTQYDYDPEKAAELLDEAGYTIPDGEEWRTDPDGNEFIIKFGHFAGTSAFEGRAQAIIQNWKDVGLQTELATGQLIEFNTYNDMKNNDDENIQVFFGAWSTGSDPDPSGLWHSQAEWNHGRWINEESDALLEDGLSEKSFDQDYREQVYVDWQKIFNEELPGLPLWENMDLYGVNTHLQDYVIDAGGLRDFHKWYIEK